MSTQQNIPDFFIVGAPKCGTTALDYHLSLHPEIFMGPKEMHYFGKDIGMIQDDLNEEEYLNVFNEAQPEELKGESSVWYLYSSLAPQEIKAMNPNAKIIVMLRKPMDMIPSLHGQYLYNGIEETKDFNTALLNDTNQNKKTCALFELRPRYIESANYTNHVKRYMDAFGDNLLILFQEELKENFTREYRKTLEFLGLKNTEFTPESAQVNVRKEVKNVKLHQMSKTPPSGLKKAFRTLVPSKKIRHAIMQWVEDRNVQDSEAQDISDQSKALIKEGTTKDIEALEKLLNKDLTYWKS